MRVIRTAFFAVLFFGILGAVGAVLVREGLLYWGAHQMRRAVAQLREVNRNSVPYRQQCLERTGSQYSGSPIERFQLRFLDDRTYVLEVLCTAFKLEPILISQNTLPPFVTKKAGSSGLAWDTPRTGFEIAVWGRSASIVIDDSQLIITSQEVDLGVSPVSSCQSYGYTCCEAELGIGAGGTYPQALDCPRTCYSQCKPRPVVFSFAADPFMDPTTRTVKARTGEQVTFAFVVSVPTEPAQIMIDFGDGTNQLLTDLEATVPHVYSCRQANCTFQVQLKVTDAMSQTSFDGPVTKMTVEVSGS